MARSDVLVKMMEQNIETEVQLVTTLREADIRVEVDLIDRSMKKLFAFASKLTIPFVIVIGKKELTLKELTIKNMKTETQETMPMDFKKLVDYIKKGLH